MSKIFTHLKSTEIPDDKIEQLEKAGYITIAVDSFDDVRLMTSTPMDMESEQIRMAVSILDNSKDESAGILRQRFGNQVLQLLKNSLNK